LEVARIAVLEGSALANLDRDGAEVRREAVECWEFGFDERGEAADGTGEVVLAFGFEALDGWDGFGPEVEEGDEYGWAGGEGEVVSRGGLFSAGKGDGWRTGCAA
jgi:hypothetical protein